MQLLKRTDLWGEDLGDSNQALSWALSKLDFEASMQELYATLSKLYATNRYYHTNQHVSNLLLILADLALYYNLSSEDLAILVLVAWFHDVIYDTTASDNEEKSATFAQEVLTNLRIAVAPLERVQQLILATKSHQALENDLLCKIFLDADLAILGSTTTEYADYAHGVRQEYAWVADKDYIAGRTGVLTQFLKRPRLYFTDYLYNRLEKRARSNIQTEITQLASKTS
jgi:predicted metal-dependent HD superfamily phosphohydrolase